MLGVRAPRPSDLVEQPDGTFKRYVLRYRPDGSTYQGLAFVCERCWELIPNYQGAPCGYLSPDSARKLRVGSVEGRAGIEAMQKLVCYECLKQDSLETVGAFEDFVPVVEGLL